MLNKLKEIYDISNKLWHEDAYDMAITCQKSGWELCVTHRYVGKTGVHPEATVLRRAISPETADSVIAELKAGFVARATQLSEFRKQECDAIYARLKVSTEEFTKRLFVLDELKKIS